MSRHFDYKMENFLRDGVSRIGSTMNISSGVIAGEAHFFEDATTPAKVRQLLDSNKVVMQCIFWILILYIWK